MALAGCVGSTNPDPLPVEKTVLAIRKGAGGGSAGPVAVASTGTGWGALKGVLTYQGEVPGPKALSVKLTPTDAPACGKHPIPDETLVVDSSSRGIANIVVYARKVTRVHESSEAAKNAPTMFDQKECRFLEHVKAVLVGQPIAIKNSDPMGHNTNITPVSDASFNGLLPAGSEANYSFSRAQSNPVGVACNVHPWMKAYIIPRKDAYCAVTKADGSFEIANLPAGEEIELQFWHERGAGNQDSLEAAPIAKGGRLKVTLADDDVKDLGTIEVPAAAFTP